MLHLEELPRPVRPLAERHDPRVADERLEGHEVVESRARFRGAKGDGMGAQPGKLLLAGDERLRL